MAEADLAKGNKQAAAAILTDYEKKGGRKSAGAETTGFARRRTRQTRGRGGHSRPPQLHFSVDEDLHRHLGDLWFAQNNTRARSANTAP